MAARRRRSHGRHAGLIWGLVGLLSCVSTPSGATSPDEEWLTATKTRIDQVWIGSFLRDCQSQLPVEHPINRAQPSAILDLTVAKDGTRKAPVDTETKRTTAKTCRHHSEWQACQWPRTTPER